MMVELNARMMARMISPRHEILHYTSSGSEHDGARDSDRSSELSEPRSLSNMVEWFLEESWEDDQNVIDDADRVLSGGESTQRVDSVVYDEMTRILSDKGDHYRNLLASQVRKALETMSFGNGSFKTATFHDQPTVVLRDLMTWLRSLGHNAAVCNTKWDTSKSGSLVSGSHEFIDVVLTTTCSNQTRYIIELNFASKFELARPTQSFTSLLKLLPTSAIVAAEEEMRRIVKLMSDEAKRSLKSKELHFPPWRKNRYMQMKWFGPYKRTTNAVAGGARSCLGGGSGGDGKWKVGCRAVGFEPVCAGVVKGRYFVSTG